jgi:nicotinate-nucleotide adenylyltransferase
MKVGLYFGSFNPIHVGHCIIASHMAQNTPLDQVWLVVSPQNPLKPSGSLLNEYHRLYLVNLALEGDPKLKASDIEFHLPRPSYTVDTLAYLREKYPTHEFSLIMGSDSLQNLPKWKNYGNILENFSLYVYKRAGFEIIQLHDRARISEVEAPLLQISATHIRESVRKGMSIRYLVPENVREEIERNRYYQQ